MNETRSFLNGLGQSAAFFSKVLPVDVNGLWVAHLRSDGSWIASAIHDGETLEKEFPFRAIVDDAVALEADGAILALNFPAKIPDFCYDYAAAVQTLRVLAEHKGLTIVDHVERVDGAWKSMRQMGLL